jgi:deoxyribonuclease-4
MAKSLESIARLWEAVSHAAEGGGEIGFCLDTCHANSAGIELADSVDRIKAITGQIDLVHCNNSRDEFDSGADRHANFDKGTIDKAVLLDLVRAAGAPVICETPEAGLASDINWLLAQGL